MDIDNVFYIEFKDKSKFPSGIWKNEPDFCSWKFNNINCLAIRDMNIGMWKGYVGLPPTHDLYNKDYDYYISKYSNINIYGGVALIGKLLEPYSHYNFDYWWVGFECTQINDLLPLIKYKKKQIKDLNYKSLKFVINHVNFLAKSLFKIQ